VEVNPTEAEQFRAHLRALGRLLQVSSTEENLKEVAASFRGELREYRDRTHEWLARLHEEVIAATAMMKGIAESVVSNGADHEKQLERELRKLRSVSQSGDLREIREGIRSVSEGIAFSVDQMRRSNQLVVAQLQDEIRMLHREAAQRSSVTDRASGAWNRQKIAEAIEERLSQDELFCLLQVGLMGLRQLHNSFSRTIIEGTLKAVLMRLQNTLGKEALIGRWSEESFVAILPVELPDAIAVSREVTRKLSGDYTVQENGLAQTVPLHVTADIIDRGDSVDPAGLYRKLEQLAAVVRE